MKADGAGGFIKLVELLEVCPGLAFREDGLQIAELVLKLGLHHSQGDHGFLADTVAGDLPGVVGDTLQTVGERSAPSIHHCGGGGGSRLVKVLELGL